MDSLWLVKLYKHVVGLSATLKTSRFFVINAEDNNDYAFLAARSNAAANFAFAC